MTAELYQAIIVEHDRNPHHHGPLAGATCSATADNPLCGDVITLHAIVDGDRITAITFEGRGCALSRAAASILTDRATSSTRGELAALAARFEAFVAEPADAPIPDELGDLAAFAGVRKVRSRRTCATLAFAALRRLEAR
ncbi:MAG: Fe-S cluster assembly sulfur transfer protein SufU [Kofleriaceae bacterium]